MCDFEDTTVRDANRLYIKDKNSPYYMANWIVTANTGNVFFDGGHQRPNSPTPHSGSNMVGAEITSTTPDGGVKRAQLDLRFQRIETSPPTLKWIDDEYFLRGYYYLDPTWEMNAPINWNWCTLQTVLNSEPNDMNYMLEIQIKTVSKVPPLDPVTDYKLTLSAVAGKELGGWGKVEAIYPEFSLASFRGSWHLWEIYVKRGTPDVSRVIFWLDGVKLLDGGGFPSLNYTGEWFTSIPKTYAESSDTQPKTDWFDDLEIWNGMPS
jgi:hypothetical protein